MAGCGRLYMAMISVILHTGDHGNQCLYSILGQVGEASLGGSSCLCHPNVMGTPCISFRALGFGKHAKGNTPSNVSDTTF